MSFIEKAVPLVLEAFAWSVMYIVVGEKVLMPLSAIAASSLRPKKWAELKNNPGVFAENEQDEFPLSYAMGTQHTFSGLLVLLGYLWNDLSLVQHGVLCEVGWEIKDLICLFAGLPPYGGRAVIKPAIKKIVGFHHLPGIMAGIPMVVNNFHARSEVQLIAVAMMGAGGLGVLLSALLNLFGDISAFKLLTVPLENIIFTAARFYIFPRECYKLIMAIHQTHFIEACLVGVGFLFMMFFNVVLQGIKFSKLKSLLSGDRKHKKDDDAPAPKLGQLARQASSMEMFAGGDLTEAERRFVRQVSATSFLTAGE